VVSRVSPVRDGAKFTVAAVGLKVLVPAGARQICAVIVTLDVARAKPAATVKDAEIAVKVPARATEKASFTTAVKSTVVPTSVGSGKLVPNPTMAGVLTPTALVKTAGPPEANAIKALALFLTGGFIQAASIAVNGPELQLICPVSTRKQPELP
jgi:hypothetical protein